MAPKDDGVVPWFRRAGTIAAAIVALFAATSGIAAFTVRAAEKVLFYHSLPEVIRKMDKKMNTVLEVVCAAHPSAACKKTGD